MRDRIIERVSPYGGEIIQTSLDTEQEGRRCARPFFFFFFFFFLLSATAATT